MNIGVNTFGLRELLYADFDKALEDLKEAGITTLEVCVEFPSNPDAMPDFPISPDSDVITGGIFPMDQASDRIRKIRQAGLKVIGVHPMCFFNEPQEMIDLLPLMIEFAKENDIKYYVNSPMRDASQLEALVPMYQEMSEKLAEEGIEFMIHNHELEVKEVDGRTGLDLALDNAPELKLELDVGWALYGGASPVELMDRYSKHFGIVHLKDIREDACEENRAHCCRAVGEGAIPLREIVAKAMELKLGDDCLVIDQDESDGDMLTDIRNGVKNIEKYI